MPLHLNLHDGPLAVTETQRQVERGLELEKLLDAAEVRREQMIR